MSLLAGSEDRELVDGAVPPGLTAAFGDHPVTDAGDVLVRFADGSGQAGELTVATRGDGLWRRAPWPAADALFAVPDPTRADAACVLVVHADEARRAPLVEKLAAHGLSPSHAPRLRLADLLRAATVVFLDDGGFPPLAPAACAAGRLVIVQHPGPLFGWQDGVDCFVADDDRCVVIAQTVGRAPQAFDAVRAMARLAARPHRASEVYERLAFDLSAGVGRDRAGQRQSA
jgi:hypothetical protein